MGIEKNPVTGNCDIAVFEVRTKDHVFRIWADGRTEGFKELAGEGPCIVTNRMPLLIMAGKENGRC